VQPLGAIVQARRKETEGFSLRAVASRYPLEATWAGRPLPTLHVFYSDVSDQTKSLLQNGAEPAASLSEVTHCGCRSDIRFLAVASISSKHSGHLTQSTLISSMVNSLELEASSFHTVSRLIMTASVV
jgi:hypothetical protein